MEIRTLKYFLAVVQEGNISNAAKRLHVTQPTLSRQLSALEDELGRQLYTRGHSGIVPTEHGVMLAQYAENIIALAEKAEADISLPSKTVSGSVHIAAGETKAMGILARAMTDVRNVYPGIDFQLYSGTTAELMDGLVRGQYDFLLECDMQPHVNLNVLELPDNDVWGIVALKHDPVAKLDCVRPENVVGRQLITSRQGAKVGPIHDWLGEYADEVNVVATYSLGMNAKWLIRNGFGIAFAYDELLVSESGSGQSDLVFIPLEPRVESRHGLVWRKALPTRQAQVFLDAVRAIIEEG
ncbi:MAG: LysR family transcriptional regulator [Eggerthellaceae bacterium]|nr:LysR family transcriptional regulator [Eggerthellaceae bacterium]